MAGSEEAKSSAADGPSQSPRVEEVETERSVTVDPPATSASSDQPLLDCSDLEAQLQSLVEQMRARERGCLVTKEGRVVTYPLAESSELVLIDGPEAWQFHDNPRYADCILEVPGLPKMHACAAYLSLRSSFFEALFSSEFSEAHTRVVTVRPPSPSAFLSAVLPFLYTGQLSDTTDLQASITNSPSEFWSAWETASFLGCPQLLDTCTDLLIKVLATAISQDGWVRPLLSHAYFTPDNVGMGRLRRLVLGLLEARSPHTASAALLAALKGHAGCTRATLPETLQLLALQVERDATRGLPPPSLKALAGAYPATAHLLLDPAFLCKELAVAHDKMRLDTCTRCGVRVPKYLEGEEEACRVLTHPGHYRLYSGFTGNGGWSCCGETRKRTKGCTLTSLRHTFLY